MLAICRTLFFLVIIFCALFLGQHHNKINISTDLKDLSPSLSKKETTQKAIDTLSKDVESRFMLIITNDNRENLKKSVTYLKESISEKSNLSINALSSSALLDTLKKYQFQLLSPLQKEPLAEQKKEKLIEEAQRKLFRVDASLQLIPFKDDPLSTFSQYIEHLLNSNLNTSTDIQIANIEGKSSFFQAISLKINSGALKIDEQKILVEDLNSIESELLEKFNSSTLKSGVFFFAADAAEKSESDIKLISTISTIGIIALLLIIFRSLTILLIPTLSILIGVLFAVGVSHYLYNSIHILTIVFGASLIGIIIDYSLHYFYHQKTTNEKRKDHDNRKRLFRAMLLSLITSLVGYSALSFSSLDALKKVALFSCCGIFAAWLSVITIGSLSRISNIHVYDSIFSSLLALINSALKPLSKKLSFSLWFFMVSIGFLTVYLFGLPTSDNPRLFFNPSKTLLAQEAEANQLNSDFEPGRYIIINGDSAEQVYKRYKLLEKEVEILKSIEGIKSNSNLLFSAMQLLPSPSEQKSNYELQSKIYAEDGIAENLFIQLGFSSQEAREKTDELNKQYEQAQARRFSPKVLFNADSGLPPVWIESDNQLGGSQYIGFALIKKGKSSELLEQHLSADNKQLEGITFINTLALSEKSLEEQRLSASMLLLLAYVFIALLMLLYYRSLKALWVLLVPISATLGTLILFSLLSINITLFNIMGLFLVLGLGMDYVIFITEMLNNDKASLNPSTQKNAIQNNSKQNNLAQNNVKQKNVTQNAILLSTMTTLLSFGLLSISSIPVAQAFGTTLLIGNTLNFLASLLFAQLKKQHTI